MDFAGLTISVRGSPSTSAAFIRGLGLHPLASSAAPSPAPARLKVAGAEVNSSPAALSKGMVTVSAPVQKRLSLAVLSLRVAALPVTQQLGKSAGREVDFSAVVPQVPDFCTGQDIWVWRPA